MIKLDNKYYNVNNIASFGKVTNKVTKITFMSITFINTINGQHGINLPFNQDEWDRLIKLRS